MKNLTFIFLLLFFLFSCNGQKDVSPDMTGITWGHGAFGSSGERIYFTATSERDTPIRISTFEAEGMLMFSGRVACASCHGPNAEGGVHRMKHHMMNAPNIQWHILAGEEHGHTENDESDLHEHAGEDDHADSHALYNLDSFRMAVIGGKHPDGEPLSREMPRWQMSDEDLSDLADFLKSFD